MSKLPSEILENICSFLYPRELLQCLITCKLWNQASIKPLYTHIYIRPSIVQNKCLGQLMNNPELSKYVQSICIFGKWDDYRISTGVLFLNNIFKCCPNIVQIELLHGPSFWSYFTNVSVFDVIPPLEILPAPRYNKLDGYLNTAILFRSSLTKLELLSLTHILETQPEIYHNLCDYINQFENLKKLEMFFKNEQELIGHEKVLKDLMRMKTLTIDSKLLLEYIPMFHYIESVTPTYDVNILEIDWNNVNHDSWPEYIMKRFPNLKSLQLGQESTQYLRGFPISPDVMTEFLHYISRVPKIEGNFHIPESIWNDYIKSTKYMRKIVAYNSNINRISDSNEYYVEFKKNLILLGYTSCVHDFEVVRETHIHFMLKFGEFLVSIDLSQVRPVDIDVFSKTGGSSICRRYNQTPIPHQKLNLGQIFKRCPLLEELSLNTHCFFYEDTDYESPHAHLRSVTIRGFFPESKLKYFEIPYSNLPNLKTVHLREESERYPMDIKIMLNDTRLDLLTWASYDTIKQIDRYRVKLNDKKEFSTRSKRKHEISSDFIFSESPSPPPINFRITCAGLRLFQVINEKLQYLRDYSTRYTNMTDYIL